MVYIEKDLCINCKTCMRLCPMGVFVSGEETPEVHPRRRCIECMHCAGACPKKAIRFDNIPTGEVYPEKAQDFLEDLLRSRRSIRNFSEKLPEKAAVEKALKVANYAPSGKNQRA